MTCLADLTIGDQARIVGYEPSQKFYRHKLLVMGLVPGAKFSVVRIAPLGDPIQLSVSGRALCLRKDEAQILRLEKI